jgi:ketosteroid isomerase-like protein
MASQSDELVAAALGFLRAYWRADLSGALSFCSAGASIVLARSVPIVTPAAVSEILPIIFREIYPRFEGSRFDVAVDRTLAAGETAMVEYTARGKLTTGATFECDYAAVFDFEPSGKITRVKMYTDTRYVAAALMS